MRTLFCVLLLLAGCASSSLLSRFAQAKNETMLVVTPTGHGTGVVINDKCVLTAGHVADGDQYFVVDDKGIATAATPLAVDDGIDVGVVCTEKTLGIKPVHIAKQMPEEYAPVFTLGYPLNDSKIVTEGRYQLNGLITSPAAPGNSGGGVFDDNGSYIGLVDTISLYPSNVGVLTFPHLVGIVEATTIRKFLDDNHISYTSS